MEAIDTRGHRSVGREHQTGADPFDGGIDVASLDHPVDQLERDESGMAFVQVMHRGLPPQRGQSPCATNPQHHLLIETMMAVATVETVGDATVVLTVRFEVRVQDEKRDPAHIDAPHPCGDVSAGEWDAHHHARVQGPELERINRWVVLRLTTIGDLLIEVPVSIEEPDTGQRESPIAGRLQMITGEDPETTCVLGNERIDAELREQ